MYKFVFILLFFFGEIASVAIYAKEPPNIHFAQERVISYYNSGRYYRDIEKTIARAKDCLKASIENNKGKKKIALVLDIDDTSLILSNRKLACDMSPEEFKAAVMTADVKAITPTLDLYNFAKTNGMAVFFVTGRPEALREVTIKNLTAAGYSNWDGLYLRSNDYSYNTIVPFKSGVRKLLHSNGYDIVGNIGDQKSDLAGNKTMCKFKLPNPYYFVH